MTKSIKEIRERRQREKRGRDVRATGMILIVFAVSCLLAGFGLASCHGAMGAELPAIVAQHQPSVVAIDSCTGTYLGGKLCLTAWHVLDEKRDGRVTVKFHDGPTIQGKIVSASPEHDQATILLDERPEGIGGVPLSLKTPPTGSPVVRAGYVNGELKWGSGKVTRTAASCYSGSCQTDGGVLLITPYSVGGMSGGPIFDARTGRLIGNLWGRRGSSVTNSTVGVSAETTARLLGTKVVEGLATEQTQLFRGLRNRSRGGAQREPPPPPDDVTFEEPPKGRFFEFGSSTETGIGSQIAAGIERLSAEAAAGRDAPLFSPPPVDSEAGYLVAGPGPFVPGNSPPADWQSIVDAQALAAIERLAAENESSMWANLPTTLVGIIIVLVILLVLLYLKWRKDGKVSVADVVEVLPTALAAGAALTPKAPVVAQPKSSPAVTEVANAVGKMKAATEALGVAQTQVGVLVNDTRKALATDMAAVDRLSAKIPMHTINGGLTDNEAEE